MIERLIHSSLPKSVKYAYFEIWYGFIWQLDPFSHGKIMLQKNNVMCKGATTCTFHNYQVKFLSDKLHNSCIKLWEITTSHASRAVKGDPYTGVCFQAWKHLSLDSNKSKLLLLWILTSFWPKQSKGHE